MRHATLTRCRPRLVTLAFLLGALLLAAPAIAQSSDRDPGHPTGDRVVPIRSVDDVPDDAIDTVTLLLSAIHGVPDRATFEASVPAAREILLAVARDRSALPFHRPQALWALAHWADDDVLTLYRGVLAENDAHLIHHALLLLGQTFGERALTDLVRHLDHADLQVRLSAIAALAEIDSDPSLEALSAALERETSIVARERIAEALQHVR